MDDPLNIRNEMQALDLKRRQWYEDLDPEYQRKFSPFLMIRWGSSVQGSPELQEYYLRSTNQRLNRHFFSINSTRHKKLLWLMATAVSPDLGCYRHVWISHKNAARDNDKARIVRRLWPNLREDEVKVLCDINTLQQLRDHARFHGESD